MGIVQYMLNGDGLTFCLMQTGGLRLRAVIGVSSVWVVGCRIPSTSSTQMTVCRLSRHKNTQFPCTTQEKFCDMFFQKTFTKTRSCDIISFGMPVSRLTDTRSYSDDSPTLCPVSGESSAYFLTGERSFNYAHQGKEAGDHRHL